MSTFKTVLTALAVLAPLSANAGEISLTAPMQGATLQENNLDMSVYFTKAPADGYEVVATYVAADAAPARLKMLLTDGDSVSFSLPGHKGIVYNFSRTLTTVSVTAEPAMQYSALTN